MARNTHSSAYAMLLCFGCGPGGGANDGGGSAQGTGGSATDAGNTEGPGVSDSGGPHGSTSAGSSESGAGTSSGDSTRDDESDTGAGWPDCPDVYEGDLSINSETDLDALATTGRITGRLTIWNFPGEGLQFLSCLHAVDESVSIMDNPNLTSLSGLENLGQIGGSIGIFRNPMLTTLDGLGGVTQLFSLTVAGNNSLTSIDLGQLEQVGDLAIGNCPFGPGEGESADHPNLENLDGLSSLQSVHDIVIGSQSSLVSLGRLHEIAADGGVTGSFSTINYNPGLPYEEILLLEQLSGYDIYSCGNLGEPEGNSCSCENPP